MTNVVKYCLVYFIQLVYGQMEGFVVGGQSANIKHYPHVAFLSAQCDKTVWICGSSVLNQKILLTAAHCLDKCFLEKKRKHFMAALLGHEILEKATCTREAANVVQHRDYDEDNVENDIGLVLLKQSIRFGNNIKRIIIPNNFPKSGHEGVIAGWGLTEQKKNSPYLKHVHQQLKSQKTCRKVGRLHKGMFCAAQPMQKSYPASGDSGSGLVTLKGYTMLGIVSFKNMNFKTLTVYTNVSYYYNWVEKNAKLLYCQG